MVVNGRELSFSDVGANRTDFVVALDGLDGAILEAT